MRKKKKEIKISGKILKLPYNKINLIIRGLFDTDGVISARKDEKYRYPYLMVCSSSAVLRNQIKHILRDQGIRAYIHDISVVVRGIHNFKKWNKLIGSSNPRNLKRFKEFQETGYLKSVGSWSKP